MAEITKESLAHLAHLARLELSPEESVKFVHDLGNILNYFKELSAVDTSDVSPMTGGTSLKNVMREDAIDACSPQEHENIVKAFPDTKDNYLKTPAVFE